MPALAFEIPPLFLALSVTVIFAAVFKPLSVEWFQVLKFLKTDQAWDSLVDDQRALCFWRPFFSELDLSGHPSSALFLDFSSIWVCLQGVAEITHLKCGKRKSQKGRLKEV